LQPSHITSSTLRATLIDHKDGGSTFFRKLGIRVQGCKTNGVISQKATVSTVTPVKTAQFVASPHRRVQTDKPACDVCLERFNERRAERACNCDRSVSAGHGQECDKLSCSHFVVCHAVMDGKGCAQSVSICQLAPNCHSNT
jgi:hypothetical protein